MSGAAEDRFRELIDSFSQQKRENDKLQQEISLLKIRLADKNEKYSVLVSETAVLQQLNQESEESISIRQDELARLKQKLETEQSSSSHMLLTLKSIEATVIDLQKKETVDSERLKARIELMECSIQTKVKSFEVFKQSHDILLLMRSVLSDNTHTREDIENSQCTPIEKQGAMHIEPEP